MEKTGGLVHLRFPTFYHENSQTCRGVGTASQWTGIYQPDSKVNRLLLCDVSIWFARPLLCSAHDTTLGLAMRTHVKGDGRSEVEPGRWESCAGRYASVPATFGLDPCSGRQTPKWPGNAGLCMRVCELLQSPLPSKGACGTLPAQPVWGAASSVLGLDTRMPRVGLGRTGWAGSLGPHVLALPGRRDSAEGEAAQTPSGVSRAGCHAAS